MGNAAAILMDLNICHHDTVAKIIDHCQDIRHAKRVKISTSATSR